MSKLFEMEMGGSSKGYGLPLLGYPCVLLIGVYEGLTGGVLKGLGGALSSTQLLLMFNPKVGNVPCFHQYALFQGL